MGKNYFMVPNSIFAAGLTKYELLVLIYLLHCQNDKQVTFPGYENIAKYCTISRSKVRRVVNGLTKKGILRKQIKPESYRKNNSNWYVIVLKNGNALETDTII
jgi:predicted transcriptional regulator